VKHAAITSLMSCLKNLAVEKICNLILPALTKTYVDSSPAFKGGVALAFCEMSPYIGRDYTQMKVMPVISELMKDESADVRLNCVQNIMKIGDVLGPDLIQPDVLLLLTNLVKDAQWRVRMGTIELIGNLSVKFGREVYKDKFEAVYMSYLNNTAAAVRETGIIQAEYMGKKFGADWIISNYLPKVVENYNIEKHPYNYRMSCLNSMASMMPLLRADMISEFIVPTLVAGCADKVPNVQFCAGKIIRKHR